LLASTRIEKIAGERLAPVFEHADERAALDLFLETKVWISDYGYDATLHAFDKSARKLGVERIELLLSRCRVDST